MKASRPSLKDSLGFTLIELMAVITIIGILAAIAIPQFNMYVVRSETTSIKLLVAEIASKERLYKADHGGFLACALNPPQKNQPWQKTIDWEKLGFNPAQKLYGYQIKVEATANTFKAIASKDSRTITATQETYEVETK